LTGTFSDNPEDDTGDASNISVNWSGLQNLFLNDCSCHVLFLLDCCYGGASATAAGSRSTVEAIVAAGFEQVAPLRGPDSFTTFLSKVLKRNRQKERYVIASVLTRQISALLKSPQADKTFNLRVAPHFIRYHDGGDSILIAPVKWQAPNLQVQPSAQVVYEAPSHSLS